MLIVKIVSFFVSESDISTARHHWRILWMSSKMKVKRKSCVESAEGKDKNWNFLPIFIKPYPFQRTFVPASFYVLRYLKSLPQCNL
jgi:hypothetical protein